MTVFLAEIRENGYKLRSFNRIRVPACGEPIDMMRLLQRSRPEILAVSLALLCPTASTVQAQLFNGGGLFNRKTEAPLAPKSEDEIGVPVPVTGRVEALKGHEVTFEIRAESKTPGATVEFLIRAFPSAGKIVSMVSKPNERNKAIVTYWADPASSATEDAFSFAVRYRGGRYSSEMRYDISLVDLQTEIQVPAAVEFGEVMVGGEAVQELTVRNLGGASMERQIFLAPPWHLLDPADGKLSIGPRGARVLKIAFRPELMGETSYFLSFSRSASGTSKLIGTGADPFQVLTETVELVLDSATGVRSGTIELKNPGTRPIEIETRASTRLQGSLAKSYILVPDAVTKVPVKLAATDTAPFDGSVEFFLKNGYAKPVRAFAAVVPARLELSVPNSLNAEVINFGQVVGGRSAERGLTITNRGGMPVPLEFHVPEPFRLLTNPGKQLNPLSAVNLSIGLFPTESRRGPVDVTMNVYGADQTLAVRLLGNVVAPAGSTPSTGPANLTPNLPQGAFRLGGGARPGAAAEPESTAVLEALPQVAAPAAGTTEAVGNGGENPAGEADWRDLVDPAVLEENRSPLGFESQPVVARNLDASLRRPEDLTVLQTGSNTMELAWTAPKDAGPASYDVEVRGLFIENETGETRSVWAPYPAVKFEKIDRLVKARLANLSPYSQYELRVVMTTQDGRSSPPSEAILARTEPPMDWTYIYAFLGVALIGLLGFLGWRIYLDRRPEVYQSQYVDP